MKQILIVLLTIGLSFSSSAQQKTVLEANEKVAIISFEKIEHNFGKIKEGDKAEHVFLFKNTGNTPLIVTDVSVTCGCTAAEKPDAPIMPGKDGKIKIVFLM